MHNASLEASVRLVPVVPLMLRNCEAGERPSGPISTQCGTLKGRVESCWGLLVRHKDSRVRFNHCLSRPGESCDSGSISNTLPEATLSTPIIFMADQRSRDLHMSMIFGLEIAHVPLSGPNPSA